MRTRAVAVRNAAPLDRKKVFRKSVTGMNIVWGVWPSHFGYLGFSGGGPHAGSIPGKCPAPSHSVAQYDRPWAASVSCRRHAFTSCRPVLGATVPYVGCSLSVKIAERALRGGK